MLLFLRMLAFAMLATRLGAACLTTLPPTPPFIPPPPYDSLAINKSNGFWYGTDQLWTRLQPDQTWKGLRPNNTETGGLRQKVFWWSNRLDLQTELKPKLVVTGRRLDNEGGESFAYSDATNAGSPEIGSAMLTAIDVPTAGCWEMSGHYQGRTLTFVVLVEP